DRGRVGVERAAAGSEVARLDPLVGRLPARERGELALLVEVEREVGAAARLQRVAVEADHLRLCDQLGVDGLPDGERRGAAGEVVGERQKGDAMARRGGGQRRKARYPVAVGLVLLIPAELTAAGHTPVLDTKHG